MAVDHPDRRFEKKSCDLPTRAVMAARSEREVRSSEVSDVEVVGLGVLSRVSVRGSEYQVNPSTGPNRVSRDNGFGDGGAGGEVERRGEPHGLVELLICAEVCGRRAKAAPIQTTCERKAGYNWAGGPGEDLHQNGQPVFRRRDARCQGGESGAGVGGGVDEARLKREGDVDERDAPLRMFTFGAWQADVLEESPSQLSERAPGDRRDVVRSSRSRAFGSNRVAQRSDTALTAWSSSSMVSRRPTSRRTTNDEFSGPSIAGRCIGTRCRCGWHASSD